MLSGLYWTTVVFAVFSTVSVLGADPCSTNVNLTGTNPFLGRKIHPPKRWRDEVATAALAISDSRLREKANTLADIGTFLWIDSKSKLQDLDQAMKETSCNEILGIVLHNLPGRQTSDTSIPSETLAEYQSEYIEKIRSIIESNTNVAVAIIIEPLVLAQIMIHPLGTICRLCGKVQLDGIIYATKQLSLPNVALYLDAVTGMKLGDDQYLYQYGELLTTVRRSAGSPAQLRGYSVNVGNYNAWKMSPGEFEPADDSKYNPAQDESRYVQRLDMSLNRSGTSGWHAILDTSRNGVQGLRSNWTSWCNIVGAGLGVRPTTDTGDADNVDAFVWVKPPGESDGTSDPDSVYFDAGCGLEEALKPSPEEGLWNQRHFEMLLNNANPSL